MVKGCKTCNKHKLAQAKLPILQPELPTRPWEKLGSDILYGTGWEETTLLSDVDVHDMPSSYKLVYGRKPRIMTPSSNHALQSSHADNLDHRDMNQL